VQRTGGLVQTFGYDLDGRLLQVDDNGGNQVGYGYHSGTDALRFVRRSEADGAGGSPRVFETHYEVDSLGRAVKVKEGAQNQIEHVFAYTSLGRVDRYTDPAGRVQTFLTDALGRLVEHVRLADGGAFLKNRTEWTDWTGNASRTKVARYDGLDHVTVTHHDFAGRPFLLQNPGADLGNEPTASSPNRPFSTLAVYDALSRIRDLHDGDGGHTRLWRDGRGRLIQRELVNLPADVSLFQIKDVLKRDRLGRIVETVTFSSNGAGGLTPNLIEQIDQDSLGRTHEERCLFAGGGLNPLRVKSGYSGGDPFRTSLQYLDDLVSGAAAPLHLEFGKDTIGRLQQVRWNTAPSGGGSMATLADYTWLGGKRRGRTLHYGQAQGATSYDYDPYERLLQIRDVVGTTTLSQFDYEYDLASNLKKEWYQKAGGRVGDRFTYDAYHRLEHAFLGVDTATMNLSDAQLVDMGNPNVQRQFVDRLRYGLDEANNRTGVDNQQGPQGPEWTDDYLLQDQSHPQGPSNRYELAAGSKPLYDNRGNLTFDGQFYFKYDYLNRLTEVYVVQSEDALASASSSGSWSAVGSRTGERFLVLDAAPLEAARRQIVGETRNEFVRVQRQHRDPTFRARLRQSVRGGLVRVPSVGGGMYGPLVGETYLTLVAVYGYDAFNRRMVRAVIGEQTYFHLYDGWRECAEAVRVGTQTVLHKQFVWGARLDELLSYRRRVGAGSVALYGHQGGQDSLAVLVDGSGMAVERYEWDPYGNVQVFNGSWGYAGATSAVGNPYLWKTIRFDAETGLYWMRNRFYSARMGRFLNDDPRGLWYDSGSQGNGYTYVGNMPLTRLDPLGLQATVPQELAFLDSIRELFKHARREGELVVKSAAEAAIAAAPDVGQFVVEAFVEEICGKVGAVIFVIAELHAGNVGGAVLEAIRFVPGGGVARAAAHRIKDGLDTLLKNPCIRRFSSSGPLSRSSAEAAARQLDDALKAARGGRGAVNVTSGGRTVDEALTMGQRFVGEGAQEVGPGVFRSADETRQFRMTDADITGRHGKIGPHVHFEKFDPLTGEKIKNIHTPLKDQ
jgi:RHS repeat-associated protein